MPVPTDPGKLLNFPDWKLLGNWRISMRVVNTDRKIISIEKPTGNFIFSVKLSLSGLHFSNGFQLFL
jgi:hypothetical protein